MRVCADTFDGVDTDKAQRASKESKARLLNKPVWLGRLFMMDVFMAGSGWSWGKQHRAVGALELLKPKACRGVRLALA